MALGLERSTRSLVWRHVCVANTAFGSWCVCLMCPQGRAGLQRYLQSKQAVYTQMAQLLVSVWSRID